MTFGFNFSWHAVSYFAFTTCRKDGDAVVILLCGGTKKRQDRDIAMARERWVDYKKRKREEK